MERFNPGRIEKGGRKEARGPEQQLTPEEIKEILWELCIYPSLYPQDPEGKGLETIIRRSRELVEIKTLKGDEEIRQTIEKEIEGLLRDNESFRQAIEEITKLFNILKQNIYEGFRQIFSDEEERAKSLLDNLQQGRIFSIHAVVNIIAEKILNNLRGILREKGIIVVEGPFKRWITLLVTGIAWFIFDRLRPVTPEEIEKIFQDPRIYPPVYFRDPEGFMFKQLKDYLEQRVPERQRKRLEATIEYLRRLIEIGEKVFEEPNTIRTKIEGLLRDNEAFRQAIEEITKLFNILRENIDEGFRQIFSDEEERAKSLLDNLQQGLVFPIHAVNIIAEKIFDNLKIRVDKEPWIEQWIKPLVTGIAWFIVEWI